MSKIFWFPEEESEKWLAMRDAQLSLGVLEAVSGAPEKYVLEISLSREQLLDQGKQQRFLP